MEILELNADNVTDYEDILDQDVSESIGREFYRGIVAVGDGNAPKGAMIWEYKNLEENKDTDAEICFLRSEGSEVIRSLLAEFDSMAEDSEVHGVFFELNALSDETKQGFTDDGFDVSTAEGRDLMVSVSDLKPLASLKKKVQSNITLLSELMKLQFMQGVTNCMFHGKKGLVEDLEYIDMEWFDESISSAVITDGRVSGFLLIHRFPSGILMPVLLTAIGPDFKTDLKQMLILSAKKAMEQYPGETKVLLRRHSPEVGALTGKLFAGKTGGEVICGKKA
jgi:hypothetical protein